MTSRLVILISGFGSNLGAIIDAIASGAIAKATIVLVVSNRREAFGLQRCVFVGALLLSRKILGSVHSIIMPLTELSGWVE